MAEISLSGSGEGTGRQRPGLLYISGLVRASGCEHGRKACELRDEAAKQANARRSRPYAMVTGRPHGLSDVTRQPGLKRMMICIERCSESALNVSDIVNALGHWIVTFVIEG